MAWEVVANSWQYTSIYGADGRRLFLMDLEDWGVDENNQDQLERQQADIAMLAAAAPDMLEVVRDIVSDCNGVINPGLYKLAESALAKAEGRS